MLSLADSKYSWYEYLLSYLLLALYLSGQAPQTTDPEWNDEKNIGQTPIKRHSIKYLDRSQNYQGQ
jgi:hypothetical protein